MVSFFLVCTPILNDIMFLVGGMTGHEVHRVLSVAQSDLVALSLIGSTPPSIEIKSTEFPHGLCI